MKLSLKGLSLTAIVAAAAVAGASLAFADTLKDGSVQAKPGMWEWKQETSIYGLFNKKETNLECLIPEKAQITLSKLARDLDKGCGVENVSALDTGYSFVLRCKGKVTGKADASLTSSADRISLQASGSARWGVIWAPLSMKANASFKGDCPADELQRQREKFQREQQKSAS